MRITITIEDDPQDSVEIIDVAADHAFPAAVALDEIGVDADGFRTLIDPKADR